MIITQMLIDIEKLIPETLDECTNMECTECGYNINYPDMCIHRKVLKSYEKMLKWSPEKCTPNQKS